uniref:60S acidic ribosomal protein P0 n=1 Tax=Lotharella vacuolata TaxID=74820 RepID=A0A0H5BJX1_9EUKA|nr:60S acidic ribosomal protein P0 [Lotharella vacuolata]
MRSFEKVKINFYKVKNQLEKNLNKYHYIICVTINGVKSKQMHDIRKFMRNKASILIGRRSLINYYLKTELTYLYKTWKILIQGIKGNVGMIFTDEDPKMINKILDRFYLSAYAFPGNRAYKNIKIKKGIKRLSPSQTPFFQALGIPTRISRGSIDIIDDLLFVKKNEVITISHVVLLKKLDIKPFRYGMKIVKVEIMYSKILKRDRELDLKYLKVDKEQLKSNLSHVIKICSITDKQTLGFSNSYLSYNIYLINRNIFSYLVNDVN